MRPFLYRCPATGFNVQGIAPDDQPETDGNTTIPMNCPACGRIHLVNPKSGATADAPKK